MTQANEWTERTIRVRVSECSGNPTRYQVDVLGRLEFPVEKSVIAAATVGPLDNTAEIAATKRASINARIDEIEQLYRLTILGGWKGHSYEARALDHFIDRRMRELGRIDWNHPPVPEPTPDLQNSPEIIKRFEAVIKERDEARAQLAAATVPPPIARERLAEMLDWYRDQLLEGRTACAEYTAILDAVCGKVKPSAHPNRPQTDEEIRLTRECAESMHATGSWTAPCKIIIGPDLKVYLPEVKP